MGPHQQYLIDEIERIQRRAARWVKVDYGMMNDLKWPTLQKRRHENRLNKFLYIKTPPTY